MTKLAELVQLVSPDAETRSALAGARLDLAQKRKGAAGRLFIGLYKDGGIGDLMQEAAFAAAVRRRYPDAYINLICRDLGQDADGVPLVANILRGNPAIDGVTPIPQVGWQRGVRAFYRDFDIFYEVQYAARTFNWIDASDQHQADLLLRPYEKYTLDFPATSRRLGETQQTQWEILSASSGFDVSENDLAIQVGELPKELRRKRYVVVHSMAGGVALAKCAPLTTMVALAASFKKARIPCIQVGAPRDPQIRGALDYRGRTINVSAAIIQRARMLIDIEGGLGYVARAVGTRRAVFFGPTPATLFRFEGDIVLRNTRGGRPPCEPCWHHGPRWAVNCYKQFPICANIPTDGAAVAEALIRHIKRTRKGAAK